MTEIPREMDYLLRYSLSQEESVVCHGLRCSYLTTLETGTPACDKMIETTELDRDYVARMPEDAAKFSLNDRLILIQKSADRILPDDPPPIGCPKKLNVVSVIFFRPAAQRGPQGS